MLVGIIADDLTGACDAAVHFRSAGLRTEVSLSLCVPDADVVAFSTDSRDVRPEEVRRRIGAVAAVMHPEIVFKKIDSVLRGRPGLEIAISLDAFRCDCAVITPAYPEMGRVVRGATAAPTSWQAVSNPSRWQVTFMPSALFLLVLLS